MSNGVTLTPLKAGFDGVTFGPMQKFSFGSLVYLQNGKEPHLYVEIPPHKVAFDVGADRFNSNKFLVSLEIDTTRKRQTTVLNWVKSLDDFFVKAIAANSKAWLGEEISEEAARTRYASPLRENPMYGYPKLNLKTIGNKDEVTTVVFSTTGEVYDFSEVSVPFLFRKGKYIMGIVQVTGLYFNKNNQVSPMIRLYQVQFVDPPKEKPASKGKTQKIAGANLPIQKKMREEDFVQVPNVLGNFFSEEIGVGVTLDDDMITRGRMEED